MDRKRLDYKIFWQASKLLQAVHTAFYTVVCDVTPLCTCYTQSILEFVHMPHSVCSFLLELCVRHSPTWQD